MSASQNSVQLREQRTVEGVLGRTGLLRGASAAQLAALAKRCASVDARRGEVMVARGARLTGIHAVAQGTLKVSLRHAEGEERVLRLVQPGETFGDATALLGRPAPYEVRALSECRLVVLPVDAVYELLERNPRVARQIIRRLAERTLIMLDELEASTMRRGAQRLAAYLDSLAEPAGAGVWTVRLPATKTIIASRLDMKKETLSRLLRSLSEQGLIGLNPRGITILDRGRLGQLAR